MDKDYWTLSTRPKDNDMFYFSEDWTTGARLMSWKDIKQATLRWQEQKLLTLKLNNDNTYHNIIDITTDDNASPLLTS